MTDLARSQVFASSVSTSASPQPLATINTIPTTVATGDATK